MGVLCQYQQHFSNIMSVLSFLEYLEKRCPAQIRNIEDEFRRELISEFILLGDHYQIFMFQLLANIFLI